jgi:hypothetical protein
MPSRPASMVVADDLAALINQHRAEAAAKLEGRIQPVVPAAHDDGSVPRKRGSHSVRYSTETRDARRDSRRDSRRQSIMSQHFALSAATTGCGQGLGWTLANLQAVQPEDAISRTYPDLFREEEIDQEEDIFFSRLAARRSRFRYSTIDPTLGLWQGASHEDEAAYSEQAEHIRAMLDSDDSETNRFTITKESASDPNFQTALHAAMESFPPGVAAQMIEEANMQKRAEQQHDDSPPEPPLQKVRYSAQISSKAAWRDLRGVSNRWSRVKPVSDIKGYEKSRFSRRLWPRMSFGRKTYINITP